MALTSAQRKQAEQSCAEMVAARRRDLTYEIAFAVACALGAGVLVLHLALDYPWSAAVGLPLIFSLGTVYGTVVGWKRGSRNIPVVLSSETTDQG